MSEFDPRFMKDEELQSLLERWRVPEAPQSLDNRVIAGYNNLMGDASARRDSALSEVVKMKFCNTCQEEFADRFSFCPVDGTPLSVAPVKAVNEPVREIETSYPISETADVKSATTPSYFEAQPTPAPTPAATEATTATAAAAAASGAMLGEYHLTILEDRGLMFRLTDELNNVAHNYQLTWPEFKRDPFGFVKRSAQGYGQMMGKFFGTRDVMIASLLAIAAMIAVVFAVILLDRAQGPGVSRVGLFLVAFLAFCALLALFAAQLSRERGAAVMGAKPADSRNTLSGIIAAFVMLFFVVGGLWWWDHRKGGIVVAKNNSDLELTEMISDIPNSQPTPDEGTAGMAKGNGGGSKPKQEKAGGGGGGGRQEQTPASFGKLPQADLRIPQVVAPDPHPPQIKNPALPMPATLDADPALFPPDTRNLNYGDPKSKSTTASSGPGTGNGIGSGTGGGVGPGSGGGYGPGNGGNTGGGNRNEGGGGPGGGGGGNDPNKIYSGREVTSKARVLEKPEPTYTEAARKNQITGTVVLRAVFSSSGQVTNIHAVNGLPDGLTERAISAAKQIRFVPATKDGRPVSMWMELQYNFNLY
jgi:TonB family protein